MDDNPLDADILAAKRTLSVRGVGVLFLVNGLLLGLFWSKFYEALGGPMSAHPEALGGLVQSGYAILIFACLGYILVLDMETYLKDGREVTRRITVDWAVWCLAPLAVYVLASALALDAGLSEPRHVALAETALTGALMAYGLFLTRRRIPVARAG